MSAAPDGLAVLREERRRRWVERERGFLESALLEHDWNLSDVARALGCPISSLQCALDRHPDLEVERQKWALAHGWLRRYRPQRAASAA